MRGAKDEKLEESFGYSKKKSDNCIVTLVIDSAGKIVATAINV